MSTRRTTTRRVLLPTLLPALLLVQALPCSSLATAQVAVLRVDPAAEGLCAVLESALTDAQLVRDPGYFTEARSQGLDPSTDATIEVITPLLGLRLAVVPLSADESKVNVEFRDGRSGASLGMVGIPLENGLLGFLGRSVLRREVFRRLGAAPPPTGAAAGATPMQGDPEVGDDAVADGAEETADEPDGGRGLRVDASIGLGFGTRSLEWRADGRTQSVETGMFAAYELSTRFALPLSESVELGPELVYQSSLAHAIEETHVAAPTEKIGIRSHRFAGLMALTFRLGEERSFSIAPAIGYGARSLRPEVHHLLTPSYSLAGPIGRIALGIAFGDSVSLVLAPEAQWILVGDELEEEGVDPSGVSLGGDAALELAVSRALSLGLTYRQAHALLAAQGVSATDVERFVTTHLRWTP